MSEPSREHDQQVARMIRDRHGIEMTPGQVAQTRKEAYAKIREELNARGFEGIPDGDQELLDWMKRLQRGVLP
jgi:hypothetical protein